MTITDLQNHLGDLARFLDASGAAKIGGELKSFCGGLDPFRDLSLKAFGEFLKKAHADAQGIPAASSGAKGGKKPGSANTAKAPLPNVDVIAHNMQQLYDQAAQESTTHEKIESGLAQLIPLTKNALVIVAEQLELKGMKSRTKDDILREIRQRILARKDSAQRASMIDRPESGSTKPAAFPQTEPTAHSTDD